MAASAGKNMVMTSFAIAGLVAFAALLDLIAGFPFSGQMTFDILFLIGAGIVGYLAWDAYREMA